MERLCASIAFARRTARRLQLEDVADQLCGLLHMVHIRQKQCQDHVDKLMPDSNPWTRDDGNTPADTTRCSLQATSLDPAVTPLQPLDSPEINSSAAHEAEMVSEKQASAKAHPDFQTDSHNIESQAAASMLPEEYDTSVLRRQIRGQLQQFSRQEQANGLVIMCQQALDHMVQSSSKPLEFQVVTARMLLVCLEERLGLSSTLVAA
eukprot:Skav231403  [mRNA]  locus=scaffold4039:12317:12937:+ [translate_table: standard]